MNRKESLATIRKAFDALRWADIYHGFNNVADRLFDMNLASEKQHRRGRPAGADGISVRDAAKLFTVRRLAESIERTYRPYTADDILSIRNECLYAQAYAKKYRKEIRAAWRKAGVPIADILALDYAALMDKAES